MQVHRRSSLLPRWGGLAALVLTVCTVSAQEPSSEPQDERSETGDGDISVEVDAESAQTPASDIAFEGALSDSENGQGLLETAGYRRLLEIVRSWPEEDFNARPRERLDYAAVMADPAAWRGRLVTVRGLLVKLGAERLARPIWEEVDVYRAIVTEADASEGVYCDLLGQPPGLPLEEINFKRDLVDVDGVFYRTLSFENKRNQMTEVPYIIAKRIRLVDLEGVRRSTVLDQLFVAFLAAAVVLIVLRVTLTIRRHRRRSLADRRASLRNHPQAPK